MSNKAFGWFIALLVVGALVVVAGINNGWIGGGAGGQVVRTNSGASKASTQPTVDPNVSPGPGYVKAGGIWRPAIDVEKKASEETRTYVSLPSAGSSPVVPFEINKATKLIQEALKSGKEEHQSRLSAMHEAKPFDRAAYEKDPQPYLDEVEPGRIWQSADEGEGVMPIGRLGDFYRKLIQGESAPLSVRTAPNAPATFYSPALGRFEKQLTSITVKADEKGIATAVYTASLGSHDEVTVVAASPMVSGQARFLIDILVPEKVAPQKSTLATLFEGSRQ